jgi:hypothetical protein
MEETSMDTYLKEIDGIIDDLNTEIQKKQAREFILYLTLRGMIKKAMLISFFT